MKLFGNSVRQLRQLRQLRQTQCQLQRSIPLLEQRRAMGSTQSIPNTTKEAITRILRGEYPGLDENSGSITAAAPIDLESLRYARPVPVSPSYFTRAPRFIDDWVHVQGLLEKYRHLPTAPSSELKRVAWKTKEDYRQMTGEPVRASHYSVALAIVKRLYEIHPTMVPEAVKTALVGWQKDIDPFSNVKKPTPIDRFGRAIGVGRRKEATARAWVVEGTGEFLVNGKTLPEAFGRVHDRESALWALHSTGRTDKYNVWALVEGGGTTGQAEALTLAVSNALLAHEPDLKPALRRAGCVTRDPRTVERKKAGHLKARKSPAWVKR